MTDQLAPGLTLGGRHHLPAFGVLEELLTLLQAQTGKLDEGADALNPLSRRQTAECLQRLLNLPPLRVRERPQRLVLFPRRELEKLVEPLQRVLPLVLGHPLPLLEALLQHFAASGRNALE